MGNNPGKELKSMPAGISSNTVSTSPKKPLRMLLVDDEPSVCDAIKRILAEDGHEVLTAASGADALLAYRVGQFDLLITDYEMPVMKGDKLAAAIKRLAPQQLV